MSKVHFCEYDDIEMDYLKHKQYLGKNEKYQRLRNG